MIKTISNLSGVKTLSKNVQKSINGGFACYMDGSCPGNSICCYDSGLCRPSGNSCDLF